MMLERNKGRVQEFFAALERGDRAALRALVHDDLRWVVPRGAVIHAGTHRGAEAVFDRMFSAVGSAFVPGSARTAILRMVAEGDVVVAEARVTAKSPDGTDYDNGYVFVFELRDGRIVEIREHVDTRYAAQFFGE